MHILTSLKKISLIDYRTKHLLLNALGFPHINYCLSSWSGAAKIVINRFDSLLHNIDKVSYIDKSIMDMANFQKSIVVFKAINKLCPEYFSERFNLVTSRHSHYTRNAANKNLLVQNTRNKLSDRTFLRQSTTVRNSLPTEMKQTQSMLKFKCPAKQHFFEKI